MSVADTKDTMGGFKFLTPAETKKSMSKGGLLMKYLKGMGKTFATAENPTLKNYSKTVDTSFLPL